MDNRLDLFVADVSQPDPGVPQKVALVFTHTSSARVLDFAWSPDSTKLAFRANPDASSVFSLYVADVSQLGGGSVTPVRVNADPALSVGLSESQFRKDYDWSRDSTLLAFGVNAYSNVTVPNGYHELWLANVLTSPTPTSIRVDQPGIATPAISQAIWGPTSKTLVYHGVQTASRHAEMFAVTITADASGTSVSAPSQLLDLSGTTTTARLDVYCRFQGSYATNREDYYFREGKRPSFSPDGTRLAFVVDNGTLQQVYVSAVAADGTVAPAVTATAAGVASGNFLSWLPTGNRLLCTSGTNIQVLDVSGALPVSPTALDLILPATNSPTFGDFEGVQPPAGQGGAGNSSFDYGVFAGGTKVYCRRSPNNQQVHVVDISAASPTAGVQVNLDPGPPSATIPAKSTFVTPDGDFMVFLRNNAAVSQEAVYIVDVSGPTPGLPTIVGKNKASPISGSGFSSIAVTPDSRYLVWLGDLDKDNTFRLYSFDIKNGVPVQDMRDIMPPLSSTACTGVRTAEQINTTLFFPIKIAD